MSWATGSCEECKGYFDYRYSWGYEKPDGLDKTEDGKLLCGKCRRDHKNKLSKSKRIK